jgi:membrane-bound serine protease (ClpP class)
LINRKALIKYILLQIPDLILLIIVLIIFNKVINISTRLMLIIIAIWIAKDIALFPKVWKAFDSNNPSPMEQFIGMHGIVMDNLNPAGYVEVKGELWKAEIRDPRFPLKKGDKIKVSDVRGMTLIVERESGT